MRKRWLLASLLLTFVLGTLGVAQTQSGQTVSGSRKAINKVVPQYPSLARQMNLQGTVRLEVSVGENGSVKSVEVKGGSPLLVQSAQDAVRLWRWEKADHETVESVEFNFRP